MLRTTGISITMTKSELLRKFKANNCSAEEAQLAMQYIQEDPALLDELFDKKEWDNVDDSKPLHPDLDDELRKGVFESATKRPLIILKRIVAVAASLAAIVFFASVLMTKTQPGLVKNVAVIHPQVEPATREIANSTSQIKEIRLADNSVVTLYPQATIEYPTQFLRSRNIYLTGKAVFEVAKDKANPFTVYTGSVATTAIGTKFLVDNSKGQTKLNIQLYEGRVVVKAVDSGSRINDTYLTPGQQCFIDVTSNKLIVQSIKTDKERQATKLQTVIEEKPRDVALNLDFVKTPLTEVFERIGKVYDRKIEFEESDRSDLLFTGYFTKEQSLEKIIRLITGMNGLAVAESNGNLKIYRDKEIASIAENTGLANDEGRPDDSMQKKSFSEKHIRIPDNNKGLLNHVSRINTPQPEFIFEKEGIIYFNNVGLKSVIHKVMSSGGYYIIFDEHELEGKYFTGQIEINRSTINMLSVICRMNGLKLEKKGELYNLIKL